uniref:Uncharacterized protein MANES_03G046400 n=1 Tax=Rhizophora mucronata TaxID=61149 RepID=A0A2P2KTE5_RHIMU
MAVTVIRVTYSISLIGSLFIGSHYPAVHTNCGSVDGSGGRVVFDLDLHAPRPLPVTPPQDKIGRGGLPSARL